MTEKVKLLSGHTVEPLTEEEESAIVNSGVMLPSRMVRLQPDGWLLPDTMPEKYLDKIYNFKVRQLVRVHVEVLVVCETCNGIGTPEQYTSVESGHELHLSFGGGREVHGVSATL